MISPIQPTGILPGGVLVPEPERFETEPWVELGWPGLDPVTPTLHIHSFDDSGSITAPQGADPVGNRFEEARQAIKLVSTWSRTSRAKIAILHFDDPVGASGIHPMNDRRLLARLAPSLRIPRAGMGTSDLGPSLDAAERLAAENPDHQVTFTVFSDFDLTDEEPTAVMLRLARFPGHVHAVVLGEGTPPDLVNSPSVTVTVINEADARGTFAAALHRSMTATRRGARRSVLHRPHSQRGGH